MPIRYRHYVFDMPGNMAEGAAVIEETFRLNLERMDPWPFTHNHVIDFEGDDRARGFVYTEFRMGSQRMRLTHVGVYEDEYVKIDGR